MMDEVVGLEKWWSAIFTSCIFSKPECCRTEEATSRSGVSVDKDVIFVPRRFLHNSDTMV